MKFTQDKLEKFLAGYEMIEYDMPSSEDEEIEYYKSMMKQTKGKGITHKGDKDK